MYAAAMVVERSRMLLILRAISLGGGNGERAGAGAA